MIKSYKMPDYGKEILKIAARNRRRKWYRNILRVLLWPVTALDVVFGLLKR